MADITVHAGDFLPGKGTFLFGVLVLKTKDHSWSGESIQVSQLDTVELATEESVKRIGGTIGWGVVGGALLGPVGLLAGLLLGGRKTQVTFVARFKDGRKMLAAADSKTFTALQAACFGHKGNP